MMIADVRRMISSTRAARAPAVQPDAPVEPPNPDEDAAESAGIVSQFLAGVRDRS